MQPAALSYDYLLSPAFCDIDSLELRIRRLIDLKNVLKSVKNMVYLENGALEELLENGKYPAEGSFRKNLAQANIEHFTAKDIAKMANSVLQNIRALEEIYPQRVTEWNEKKFDPQFQNLAPYRAESINRLIEIVSVESQILQDGISVLHYCQKNKFDHVSLHGKINYSFPDEGLEFPMDINASTSIFSDHKLHFANKCGLSLYSKAISDEEIRFAIYAASLERGRKLGRDIDSLDFSNVRFSPKFVNSLAVNQCLPNQQFSGAFLNAVAKILSNCPVGELATFDTSRTSNTPRKMGEYTAYREHVTKSGLALRLLFWRKEDGDIILANVGPKKELVIENPN